MEDIQVRANRFRTGGIACIIYAVVTAICLYRNSYGIMTIFFAAATIGFLYFIISKAPQSLAYDNRQNDSKANPHTIIYYVGIMLLGISVFLTADHFLIVCSYIGIYFLAMTVLFNCFCRDEKWGILNYFSGMLRMLGSPFSYFFCVFQDGYAYIKQRDKKKSTFLYILIGVAIAVPFLILLIYILAQADMIFKYIVDKSIGSWRLSVNTIEFIVMIVAMIVIYYSMFCRITMQPPKLACEEKKSVEPMIGITFCGLLTALYAVFSVIQILSPFLGKQMLPEGYSYAEYARQGFFQLIFVAALNLLIVLICNRIFAKSHILRTLLTVMCGCTYIMIASSAIRLLMYIQVYHLSYMRVLALFALLNLVCLFAGTIVYLYKHTFPLVNYMIVLCGGIYILFSFSHPDTWIMRYNLNQTMAETNQLLDEQMDIGIVEIRLIDDVEYMLSRSADTTPAVFEFLEWAQARGIWTDDSQVPDRLLAYHSNQCTSRRGVRTFNVSTYRGKAAIEEYIK